ncbi:Eco57I restriction-modification methylase domain-containing protein [Achromobacter sp. D10]|uniref:Eco57I restriction-modification methylase domain-containing protein n=1 Tax=Achromobacter sp. D10 TaxID=3110765 RepID=UPI002B4698F4|nr:Eco57I restriction-modification methylase domain-containing protein [Achromobacter sp. D10]MEB3098962.1 Eco57I restriction-modification methylase domain-containing protein [Achromobacter sp. D10]
MSNSIQMKQAISQHIQKFSSQPLRQAALSLFSTLGYASDRTVETPSVADFRAQFDSESKLEHPAALIASWQSAELLFQLTDEELSRSTALFKDEAVKTSLLQSYVFIAIELADGDYARGKLAGIARQINRIFPMPVMVLFKIGGRLSIAVINRRLNKRDDNKDVLGKVTLIRNIAIDEPHPGHLDILASFSLAELTEGRRVIQNFDQLHAAWEEVFNVELLNKRFYRELANWYFWALPQVDFPADIEKDDEKRRATGLIRLLTRLIFCWFLKEKGLVPDKLFAEADLKKILKDLSPNASTYNEAILQNLFFATLNQRMGKDKNGQPFRAFATDEGLQKNRSTYGVDTLYRYEDHFRDPATALEHFADVPFLNGGLFECLDRIEDGTGKKLYLDGFSRNKKKRPAIPNHLFFGSEHEEDLSGAYGDTKRKREKVRGLLHILNAYKFTIVENTPVDQEIALDPELLGKVFENLLASYNEETKTTARKQTGSFYTPRPIVEYMVDESLKAHLTGALAKAGMSEQDAKAGLDILFAYTERAHPFNEKEAATLLDAIHICKILDPACGSGAFPMGMLHKLVYIIHKLDPDNARWKQLQIDAAAKIPDISARDAAIAAIERDFADNEDDYGRKLYLIENCLYGVDIQPIAIQISKLRFFISLICDQRTNRNKRENHGIRPLPNLETKFVAADALIGLEMENQFELFASPKVKALESELQRVRHDHFAATTRQRKLALQKRDNEIREALATELQQGSFGDRDSSRKLAAWNPYDPQQSAEFFEPLWMFDQSLVDGFDIVVGNPPYISVERFSGTPIQAKWQEMFATYAARGDVYCFFYERGIDLLRKGGTLIYITSNKWMRAGYGKNLRDLFIKKVRIDEILDFGGVLVFNSATVDTCTIRLSKNEPQKQFPSSYMRSAFAFDCSLAEFTESNSSTFKLPLDASQSWAVLSSARQAIREQVRSQGVPIGRWNIKIGYGIKSGFNEAFYLTAEQRNQLVEEDSASDELIVKLIRGREVERYKVGWEDTYQIIVKFGAHEYLEDRYPAVYRHLHQFEKQLKARGQCQYSRSRTAANQGAFPGQHHWLELDNNPTDDYLNLFREPKIIYPEITKWLGFYLDQSDNYFPNNKAFIINSKGDSLSYLVAFFNSTVFRCSYIDEFPTQGEDRRELRKIFFDKIPVKKPTAQQAALFEKLVPMVQLTKRIGEDAAASFLEDLIDACIMECYFNAHMAERDLLFIDALVPHLAVYDPNASDSKQRDFIAQLYRSLNEPASKIRNRLLRISADSPDLLAVIKEEGKV